MLIYNYFTISHVSYLKAFLQYRLLIIEGVYSDAKEEPFFGSINKITFQ